MANKILNIPVIQGDGTSDSLTAEMMRVVNASLRQDNVNVNWIPILSGIRGYKKYGDPMPKESLDIIREHGVAIKGPINTPQNGDYPSVNVGLRKTFDLYACVRPCKYRPNVKTRIKNPENIDMVIIRENIEDIYSGMGFQRGSRGAKDLIKVLERNGLGENLALQDSGFSIKSISVKNTQRIMLYALNYAKEHGRKHVCIGHKDTIMPETDGLWKRVCYATYETYKTDFPGIQVWDLLIDNNSQKIVDTPEMFDVLLQQNYNGDVTSDIAAAVIGGLGFAPGANYGDDCAIFEATHGSWPKAEGRDWASPISLILSAVMMLQYLGYHEAGARIENAVNELLSVIDCSLIGVENAPIGTKKIGNMLVAMV